MRQALGPGALGKPRGSGWRGRWEGGSGWGTHVKPWRFISKYDKIHYKKKEKKKESMARRLNCWKLFLMNSWHNWGKDIRTWIVK